MDRRRRRLLRALFVSVRTPRDKNIFSDESFFTHAHKKKCCARNARCFDALPNARGDETLHLDA
jgi:hypothetical protein